MQLNTSCQTRQTFVSLDEFNDCYWRLFASTWKASSAEILLACSTILLNVLVIFKIAQKPFKKKLFDKIIMAHCIVDGLTGLLDVPFFHLVRLFGYWPLGNTAALLWASFDNGINSITNLHMLYITWARFRSIRAPNSYEKELLARSPAFVCLLIWLVGLLTWTLITFAHGVDEFTTNISFKPSFIETILIFTTWFFPLAAILPISIYVIVILNQRRRKMAKIKTPPLFRTRCGASLGTEKKVPVSKSRSFRWRKLISLGPQARFQIIITSYCIQWFPSCLIALTDPFCDCIPKNIISSIYWFTFTVCFTDPLVVLILYPNTVLKNSQKRKSLKFARLEI